MADVTLLGDFPIYGTAIQPDVNTDTTYQVQTQRPVIDAVPAGPAVDPAQFPRAYSSKQSDRPDNASGSVHIPPQVCGAVSPDAMAGSSSSSVPVHYGAESSPNEYFFGPDDALKYRELRRWTEARSTSPFGWSVSESITTDNVSVPLSPKPAKSKVDVFTGCR